MNNRLDFMTNIDKEGIDLMTMYRQAYISLDESLRELTKHPERSMESASLRTLELARTNLETSLQYAIKTLCILYENKSE